VNPAPPQITPLSALVVGVLALGVVVLFGATLAVQGPRSRR
jgi:hypothetical protein